MTTVIDQRNASADWWRGAVIYQIYPRSFFDANADGVGDLKGIVEKLSYVASLGVDAIWISPIFKSPMKDFGYDVEDYRDIDPLFGTLADFDALITRAHQLGLKVMIDQVLSHTADTHEWFISSRSSRNNEKADWYVWADAQSDGTPPNNWLSVFGGSAWQWDTRRKQYYLHNFLVEQPDLNFHCEAVQQQVLSDIRFWLERGVDGFRLDTTNYFHHDKEFRSNPPDESLNPESMPAKPYDWQAHMYDKNRPENVKFLERVRALLNEYGAASVGEVGDADALQTMIDYTSGGNRLHMTYSFSFLGDNNKASFVRRHAAQFEAAANKPGVGSWPCWTIGNHDATRVVTRWKAGSFGNDFIRMGLSMLMSLRGSVCWYQGDELALTEADLPFEALQDPPGIAFWPEYKGRDGCRTPMPWRVDQLHAGFSDGANVKPWLPVVSEHLLSAVSECEKNPDSPLHFMRSFSAWRKQQSALISGDIQFLDDHDDVLSFVRSPELGNEGQKLLCVFNFSNKPVTVVMPTAPDSTLIHVPGVPSHQMAQRQGNQFIMPAYGLYWGAVSA